MFKASCEIQSFLFGQTKYVAFLCVLQFEIHPGTTWDKLNLESCFHGSSGYSTGYIARIEFSAILHSPCATQRGLVQKGDPLPGSTCWTTWWIYGRITATHLGHLHTHLPPPSGILPGILICIGHLPHPFVTLTPFWSANPSYPPAGCRAAVRPPESERPNRWPGRSSCCSARRCKFGTALDLWRNTWF